MSAASSEWTGGFGLSNQDAELVGALLKRIEKEKGRLDTREQKLEIIARSRSKASPTHHLFEWDPAKQQEAYLLNRAGELIRGVKCYILDKPNPPVRGFVIVNHEGKKGPLDIHTVMKDSDMMRAYVEQAKADAMAWMLRYARLREVAEFAGVFIALEKIAPPPKRKS